MVLEQQISPPGGSIADVDVSWYITRHHVHDILFYFEFHVVHCFTVFEEIIL